MIEADIQLVAGDWCSLTADPEALAGRVVSALDQHEKAKASEREVPCPRREVTVVLSDDARVRNLNRRYRAQDKPTNVLAFAMPPLPVREPNPDEWRHLGDVVLAFETVKREAAAQKKPFEHHMSHLIVHGTLHLLGYDHDFDRDAALMEAEEKAVLGRLGIPDPYAEELLKEAGTVPDG